MIYVHSQDPYLTPVTVLAVCLCTWHPLKFPDVLLAAFLLVLEMLAPPLGSLPVIPDRGGQVARHRCHALTARVTLCCRGFLVNLPLE